MSKFKTLVYTVILGILLYPSVWADHLKGKSKQELDRFLKGRIVGTPAEFNKVLVSPAKKSLSLNKELIENKNTKNIDKILQNKSLLSVLYFDGQNVVIDKKSDKIQDDTKLYSFSISKSFVSYVIHQKKLS